MATVWANREAVFRERKGGSEPLPKNENINEAKK